MSADADVKHIKITSGSSDSAEPPRRKSRRSRRAQAGGEEEPVATPVVRVQKAEGGGTSPGTLVQLSATHVPGSNDSKAVPVESAGSLKGAPVGAVAPSAVSGGGGGGPKVILTTPKSKTQKVLLAAPKVARGGATTAAPTQAGGAKRKTLKKVHVSLGSLSKKLHRAKTIRKKAVAHTLDEVKKELHKAGLIKAESKAPEGILRQMYADFMTLKKKAL